MILVGLTGVIASGKTAVSEYFKRLGAHLIDADELAHQAIAPGTDAWRAIQDTFGSEILKPDQTVDRQKLGEIVFNDPEKRKRLNVIVHPHVFLEEERLRKEIMEKDPKAVIIFDAALLIETGFHESVDKVVVVTVDRHTQLKRLMERNGLSRTEAMKRIASQFPSSIKKRYADYVINGSQSLEVIERKVAEIYRDLVSLA
jgi:dephospho-CoA kinase